MTSLRNLFFSLASLRRTREDLQCQYESSGKQIAGLLEQARAALDER